VCTYHGAWYQVKPDKVTGEPVLREAALEIHTYNIKGHENPSKLDSDNEPQEDLINSEIRRSPIAISPIRTAAPVMSVTRTQPTITTPVGGSNAPPLRPGTPPVMMGTMLASLQSRLHAALQCTGLPVGGRGPAGPPGPAGPGGPRGPGGPGGPGALNPALIPQQPVAIAGDVKTMGQLPQVFTGDHAQADNFIEEVKGYLHLNQDMAGFDSPIKKIAFMLMLIKGPNTAGWM
jgi:hypothetical protein